MDMTESIVPKSDQLNADDLMTGPRTVTIEKVSAGSAEQPVDVHLVEFPGRAFRPSKSMRRVMVAAWGADTAAYTGHRMTLYRDPTIRFGRDEVGGIRISHMSHIGKSLKLALTVSRGKKELFTVEPIITVDTPAPSSVQTSVQVQEADPATREQIAKIQALFTANDVNDRAMKLNILSRATERPITSANDLTFVEADEFLEGADFIIQAGSSLKKFWLEDVTP